MWTNDMQSALTIAKQSKEAMREAFKKQADMLKEMIVITTRTTIGKNDRKNLRDVHHRPRASEGYLGGADEETYQGPRRF